MTLEEAESVARLISTADHGCSTCIWDLVERANRMFPEVQFEMARDGEFWEDVHPEWGDPEFPTRFPLVIARKK